MAATSIVGTDEHNLVVQACVEGWGDVTAKYGLAPNLCVAAARTTMDVLHHLGIGARAMPVGVVVANEQWMRLTDEQRVEALSDPTNPAWSIGVLAGSQQPEPGTFDGHLVVVVPRLRALLDPTLGQFSRPEHGITLSGSVFDLANGTDFANGVPQRFRNSAGSYVTYTHLPELRSYRQTGAWTQPNATITEALLAATAVRVESAGLTARASERTISAPAFGI